MVYTIKSTYVLINCWRFEKKSGLSKKKYYKNIPASQMSGWVPLKSQVAHFYPKSNFLVLRVIENKTLTLNTLFLGGRAILTLFNYEKYYKIYLPLRCQVLWHLILEECLSKVRLPFSTQQWNFLCFCRAKTQLGH